MKSKRLALLGVVSLCGVVLTGCNESSADVTMTLSADKSTIVVAGTAGDPTGTVEMRVSVGDKIVARQSQPRSDSPFSFTVDSPSDIATPICVWVPDLHKKTVILGLSGVQDSYYIDGGASYCKTLQNIAPKYVPVTTTTTTTTTSTTTTTIPEEIPGDCEGEGPCDPGEGDGEGPGGGDDDGCIAEDICFAEPVEE